MEKEKNERPRQTDLYILYKDTGKLVSNEPPHIMSSKSAPAVMPPGRVNFQNSYPAPQVIK